MKKWVNVKDAYPEDGQMVWYAFGINHVSVWAGHFKWVVDPPELGSSKIDCFYSEHGFLSCGDVRWWAPRIEGEIEPEPPPGAKPMFEGTA
jgi:hypothetical protein